MPVQPVGIHICPVSVSILQFLFCESCKIPNLRIVADTQIPCLQKKCQILRYYVHIVWQIPIFHVSILSRMVRFYVCAPYWNCWQTVYSDSLSAHPVRFQVCTPYQIRRRTIYSDSISLYLVRFHVCAPC